MLKKRDLVSMAVMVAIIFITLWLVLGGGKAGEVWRAVQLAKWPWLALGGFLMVCYTGMEGLQNKLTLSAMGHKVPYRHCVQFAATGFYFSSITPSSTGGQPAQVFYMARRGISAAHGTLVMLLFTIVYQVVAVVWGVAACFLAPEAPASLGTGLGVLLGYSLTTTALLTAGMIFLLVRPEPAERFCRWCLRLGVRLKLVRDLPKAEAGLERQLEEYRNGAAVIRTHPALVLKLLLAATAQLTVRYLIPWTVYRALGLTELSALRLVSTQALVYLAVSCVPIPGTVGAAEGAFLAAYHSIFGGELVAAAMLLSRTLAFYLPVLVTGASTAILHRQTAKTP